jgi:hypothetical protein
MHWQAFLEHPTIRYVTEPSQPGRVLLLNVIHELTLGLFIYQQWGGFWHFLNTAPHHPLQPIGHKCESHLSNVPRAAQSRIKLNGSQWRQTSRLFQQKPAQRFEESRH